MINNDVLRSVRYLLDLPEQRVADIVHLADPAFALDKEEVAALLLKEDEPGFVECRDALLARFLDGLIFHLRGRDDRVPARPIEARVTNNLVLKKLRVAFNLREDDLLEIFRLADFAISKAEIGAFGRAPGHRNYRACGDQVLRNFLRGLTRFRRPSGTAAPT